METRIRFWWDDQDERNEGWYAVEEQHDDGRWTELNNSTTTLRGIDVDTYGEDQGEMLRQAFATAYPDYDVIAE